MIGLFRRFDRAQLARLKEEALRVGYGTIHEGDKAKPGSRSYALLGLVADGLMTARTSEVQVAGAMTGSVTTFEITEAGKIARAMLD